jgi:hypothetical protein
MAPRKRPDYEIKLDTAGTFSNGQIIPDIRYDAVKEDYDIRLKVWDGGGPAAGDGIVQISGGKREMIKSFLEEKRYAVTSEYYHYSVRARGKKIDPAVIAQKVQDLGLKFLWVRVIGESAPDENRKR